MKHEFFELGGVALQKGGVIPDARLGYVTLGELNAPGTTSSSARHGSRRARRSSRSE